VSSPHKGVVSPNRRKFRQAITDNISGFNRIESRG
jgi:hypothetical protein